MTSTRVMALLSKRPRKKEYVCYYEEEGSYTYAWCVKNMRRVKKYGRKFSWYEKSMLVTRERYTKSVGRIWNGADWEFCPLDKYDMINRLKVLK